ncbi:uncharacterized protein LOC103278344 isoform X2 [Anolis carolinensis]|uniref:uncharacterized protein LOC103278344 isoform X2 n=1 Tax=Anolis carolinensis TaxID=28377 RepID=UPI002F2B7AA4
MLFNKSDSYNKQETQGAGCILLERDPLVSFVFVVLYQTSAAAVQAVFLTKPCLRGSVVVKLSTQKLFLDVNERQCHYRKAAGDAEGRNMNTDQMNKTMETRDLLVQSKFQQKCPVENKWERTDMKNLQSKGQLLFKEQSLNLTDSSKQNSKAENVNKEESTDSLLISECNSPIILQQFIVNLKGQISNLHKANKTAVLQLAKANEEISQLKNEMALLKTEYLQQLANCTEENLMLKKKINRMHNCHGPVDTYEQALHEEICELRSESRRIREISHQLNEENHRLKEELWDVKRQYELLMHTLTGKQDESLEECFRNNTSPSSINSDSTDILIAGYCDPEVAKKNRNLKDNITEENIEMSGNNVSDIKQHRQTCHKSSMENISCSASSRFSQMDACSKYSPHRVNMDTSVLSRRPFAPRSIADLKVGNLVKFSGPSGKISKGTVKYLGPLFGREENYLGIELEGDQVGKHDGVFQGTRYFLCKPNKGVFVNFNKIIIAWE